MSESQATGRTARSDGYFLGAFAAVAVLLHLIAMGRYGIFRDEYYYLACARHLDWGYVDHPPLSIALLAVWTAVFGNDVWALRAPGILIGAATVMLAGLIARDMGGKRFAQGLSCLAVLSAPLYLAISNFYSMNVLDQFIWTLLAWVLVRILNGGPRYWLLFGLIAGLGLENKISLLAFGFGTVVGLVLTRYRSQFRRKELWIGGAIAGLLFLPHLLWQAAHDYPTLEFLRNAASQKNSASSPIQLFRGMLLELNPANALLWLPGLAFTLYGGAGKKYRLLGVAFLVVFLTFGFTNGKVYYIAPAMPVMLALGAVAWERWTQKRPAWRAALVLPVAACGALLLPLALPILSTGSFIAYQERIGVGPTEMERHEMGPLPQHFADQFGWRELAGFVDYVCARYLKDERAKAVVLVSNYGEAGALEYYREEFNLPPIICPHNSYYLWGPGGATGDLVLAYGFDRAELEEQFESVQVASELFNHPLVMPYQNNRPIFICRGLKKPVGEVWPLLKQFI